MEKMNEVWVNKIWHFLLEYSEIRKGNVGSSYLFIYSTVLLYKESEELFFNTFFPNFFFI